MKAICGKLRAKFCHKGLKLMAGREQGLAVKMWECPGDFSFVIYLHWRNSSWGVPGYESRLPDINGITKRLRDNRFPSTQQRRPEY